jgi:hypothetical protein
MQNQDNYTPCISQIRDVLHRDFNGDVAQIELAMASIAKIVGDYGVAEIEEMRRLVNEKFDQAEAEAEAKDHEDGK